MMCLSMNAQYDPRMVPNWCGDESPNEAMVSQISLDMKARNAKRQVLPVKKLLRVESFQLFAEEQAFI